MKFRALAIIIAVFTLLPAGAALARDFEMGGDTDYSIMAPEPGTAGAITHHSTKAKTPAPLSRPHASLRGHEKFVAKLHRHPDRFFATSGSSGSVLPTPLPRTGLIGPEGGGVLTEPALPQQQGPTTVPGLTRSIPNLPHGTESFQDRASRCAFQQGLNNVPGDMSSQYMGACLH